MAYSTLAQVASEFKSISFTATTSITDTEVDEFIEQSDAVIDGRLKQLYVVPITGAVSLIIIKNISIWLTAQRVKDIQMLKTGTQPSNQLEKQVRLDEKAMKMLDDILNEDILLPDADLVTASGGVSSYNSKNNVKNIFERDTEQW